MLNRYRLILIFGLAFSVGLWGLPVSSVFVPAGSWMTMPHSSAQEADGTKRRSLFSILFGKKTANKKSVKKPSAKPSKRRVKTKRSKPRTTTTARTSSAPTIQEPEKQVVEKVEDAKTILVAGDFFAGGLADGLVKSLSDVAHLVVVDKSNGLSGFVRNDVVDWPATLGPLIEEIKPSYVIFMAGSNDRQLMRDVTGNLKKRTPEWDTAYTKRVESLGTVLKASGLPYSWIGLPPVRFKTMNNDFLYFNEQYAKAAKSEKGDFIDVWDGFSDAEGNYSRSGPDVSGQIVLLRGKDGINLTDAGRTRLAFYVEDLVLKALGGRGTVAEEGSSLVELPSAVPQEAVYDPAVSGKTIVVKLDDPSFDGADVLAGEKVNTGPRPDAGLAVKLPAGQDNPALHPARVDNFTWPPADINSVSTPAAVATTN